MEHNYFWTSKNVGRQPFQVSSFLIMFLRQFLSNIRQVFISLYHIIDILKFFWLFYYFFEIILEIRKLKLKLLILSKHIIIIHNKLIILESHNRRQYVVYHVSVYLRVTFTSDRTPKSLSDIIPHYYTFQV